MLTAYPATFGHGSFAFNAHLNANGTPNVSNYRNTVTIDRRQSDPQFREGRDAYQLTTGGALGRSHKGFGLWRLSGRIIVPDATQAASLADVERAMRAAFDPALCYLDAPATDGVYTFDFTDPTLDTTNHPTGLIALRAYCRPMAQPSIVENIGDAGRLDYTLGLIAADPRIYAQAETTLALTPGSASGNVTNKGTWPAPLRATIVMAGAGASNFTLARGGVSFVLDLSGVSGGQTVVVVMETCAPYGRGRYITRAGAEAASLKTSSPSTWLDVPVGTTSFAITNTTNVTSCTLAWRSAWA